MNKNKVLIISYYWPPAGGPGVQRWLKFVKYLPEYGIEPVVFVPKNPNYPIIDNSLLADIQPGTTVLKFPIKEPYRFANWFAKKSSQTISKGIIPEEKKQSLIEKTMLFIRGNFFIPDARVGWVKPASNHLLEFLRKENINTVITTGPPHSTHLIGLRLKKQLGIKWLADFRDPWTTIGYHKQLKLTKASEAKHKQLEKLVLNTADNVIVTSSVTKNEFKQLTQKPITVITNGYDNEPSVAFAMDKQFTLSHIGSLLSRRNPVNLWRVLKELIDEHDGFSNDFRLNLVGAVSENVIKSLRDFNLINHTNNIGYLTHKEAITYQKKSQLLLLVEIDSEETKCIIPGKLFEYMVSNRPIIALGPQGSDVEKIIKETNTGNYFGHDDYKSLKNTILEHYKSFKNNALQSYPIGLQKYHRKTLTQSLSKLL